VRGKSVGVEFSMQRLPLTLPNSDFSAAANAAAPAFAADVGDVAANLASAIVSGLPADPASAAILPLPTSQDAIWPQALHHLRSHLRQAVIDTWMGQIVLIGCLPDRVFLGVPDEHYRAYLQAHHIEDLRQAVALAAGQYRHVELLVVASLSAATARSPTQVPHRARSTPNLQRRASDRGSVAPHPAPTHEATTSTDRVDAEGTSAQSAQTTMNLQENVQHLSHRRQDTAKQPAQSALAFQDLSATQYLAEPPPPVLSPSTQTVSDRPDFNTLFSAEFPLPPGLFCPVAPVPAANATPLDGLASRFTFEQFVQGDANQLALSVAQATALHPGESVNPVFFYGGIGLGKTHLLYAIAQATRKLHPQLRVRYVPAETFIEDTINALRSGDLAAKANVRNHYRNVDMLLIDDVQFLQNKDKTQDEFFHTFNALFLAGKQIVLSCDRFPSELQSFHERLRSRFEHGLTCGISPPDRALRQAILHQKAGLVGLQLPQDVVIYLADHLRNNVRELEGGLNKLAAHSRMTRRPIDLALARSVLGPLLELPGRNLTIEVIQRVTAQHYGLKMTDLKGSKRHRSVVVPRMIATYLARKHTHLSYPDIGRAFGGRDHSTAMHACQKIDWLLQNDAAIQAAVQALETDLGK